MGVGVTIGAGVGMMLFKEEVSCAAPFTSKPAPSWVRQVECPYTGWDSNWDRRAPMKVVKGPEGEVLSVDETAPVSKAVRHIILVRHGQYKEREPLPEDKQLTALGRDQAKAVGERLRALGYPYKLPIVCSTMIRAIQTAEIIRSALGVEEPLYQESLLKEGTPVVPIPNSKYCAGQETRAFVDGSRIEAAFRTTFFRPDPSQKEDSYEIVVCHANVIRYFVCRVLQFPPERWLSISLDHCSITWVTVKGNGRVTLRSLGDSGFMPVEIIKTR